MRIAKTKTSAASSGLKAKAASTKAKAKTTKSGRKKRGANDTIRIDDSDMQCPS